MTIAEAVECVTNQLPGFQPTALGGRKELQIADCNSLAVLHAPSDMEDIHVFPAMAFGKNGGILKTILGVALIIVAIGVSFIPGAQTIAFNIGMAGLGLVIGGLTQLLTPQPSTSATHRSQYLANNQNTVAIGTPIPILYGRRRVYGQILSLEISSQDTTG